MVIIIKPIKSSTNVKPFIRVPSLES